MERRNMITVKDFKKGDAVYSLLRNTGINAESVISQVEVKSVGRTYVTTKEGVWEKRYQSWGDEYLYEKTDVGEARLLFITKEDAENYVEKCNLALWLGSVSVRQAESYSLEQLRRIKEILS